MDEKTAIAFQGGGALGAYSLGVLRHIYETDPTYRPSYVSGVSIGAFTAAIVASHPDDPIEPLTRFWRDVTVDVPFAPDWLERRLSAFGNPAFFTPRTDYFDAAHWTSFYDLSPIATTLGRYVDLEVIAQGRIKLAVTATDIASGQIRHFTNTDGNRISLDHIIASGSLPPGFPPRTIDGTAYWDGGLFDNTPLSALLNLVAPGDAAATRVIVVNLFPITGRVPGNIAQVVDRMVELQFANKTQNDVKLARVINGLLVVIDELKRTVPQADLPALAGTGFERLDSYRIFENIIPITNTRQEEASSSSDFSAASIQARAEAGRADAARALAAPPPAAGDLRQVMSQAVSARG